LLRVPRQNAARYWMTCITPARPANSAAPPQNPLHPGDESADYRKATNAAVCNASAGVRRLAAVGKCPCREFTSRAGDWRFGQRVCLVVV